jgi:hypothetical protein
VPEKWFSVSGYPTYPEFAEVKNPSAFPFRLSVLARCFSENLFKCRQVPLIFSLRFLGATWLDAAQNESRGGLSLFWPPLFRRVQLEGELSHYL